MANSIKIGDLEKAINEELTIYCDDVTEKVKKISDNVMKTLVKKMPIKGQVLMLKQLHLKEH